MTLFAYRWYLLTGPRTGPSCVSVAPLSVSFSLSLFISLAPTHIHTHSLSPLLSLYSSLACPDIPLSEFSPYRHSSYPIVRSLARSLIPVCIKMKMDRTARQKAKWIYARRGRNFHFSITNCMPRLSTSGEFLDDISRYLIGKRREE